MYHLCSPHSFCVVLFVWCTVVYARGRTHIDRALAWLRSNHLCFPHSLCVVLDVSLFMFVWCTVSVRTRSYLHWRGFMWLYGVPYVCLVYRLCSVLYSLWSVLSCLYGVPLVYARGRTYIEGLFLCMYGIPCMCCVFIMFVWCTVDVFCFFSSFLYLSAVTFSCNY